MSATAYADDFATLGGWTASGMTVSSGEVKASADNSTVGKITRTHESVVPVAGGTTVARLAFDFVVDTSMTTSTYVAVSLLDSSTNQGHSVYLKQGVGIVCSLYFGGIAYSQVTPLLAWASLVNGGRYHIEWTVNPGSFFSFYSLYDPSGNLVTRNVNYSNSVDWFNITRLVVESNTNKGTISRLAIDPSLTGSSTSGKYLSNVATFTFFPTINTIGSTVDLYIPGGGSVSELMVYFHGAGQTPNFSEMTTFITGGSLMQGFLREGVMLVIPSIPDGLGSGGTDSWGNDAGAASVIYAINFARSIIGDSCAPQHYLSYSMGTLTAARLIGYEGQNFVKSWYICRGVCDIAYTEQNTFTTQIDAAWGVSHSGSYGAAQTTFARADPLGLLGSNPTAFSNIIITMDYGTTGDAVLPQTNNCVAFDALLTTKGIAHWSSVKTYEQHVELTSIGDSIVHLQRINAGIYNLSASIIASGARDAILNRVLSGNHDTSGTPGKSLQYLSGDAYASLTGAQSEPAQGSPAVNASPLSKLAYLYKGWRNKKTQTASGFSLFADNGSTVDHKTTVSDDGTTTTVGIIATGP